MVVSIGRGTGIVAFNVAVPPLGSTLPVRPSTESETGIGPPCTIRTLYVYSSLVWRRYG